MELKKLLFKTQLIRPSLSVKFNTKLTVSVAEKLFESIDLGLNELDAAESAGITAKQFHQWKEAGDAELAQLADDPAFRTGIHGFFARSVIRGRLTFRMRNLEILKQCTENWSVEDRLARATAAAWLLEHRLPDESDQTPTDDTSAPDTKKE